MNQTADYITNILQKLRHDGLPWIYAQMVTALIETEIEKAYLRGVNDGRKDATKTAADNRRNKTVH